mmetsp:Transcript_13654/g.13376  ORF Transcript_13654/g.13376 Transcript_13654/m.13376 type:complete len:89 (+) Transcript_13654:722-988(+)
MEENERLNDPAYERRKVREQFQKEKKKQQQDLEAQGIKKDKCYLYDSASVASNQYKKKQKKKHTTFGWEVFNDDSLYRAYDKRVKKLQ